MKNLLVLTITAFLAIWFGTDTNNLGMAKLPE